MNFFALLVYVALTAIDYLLRPQSSNPRENFNAPKTGQGDPIPVVFGTVPISAPVIIYASTPYVVPAGGFNHWEGEVWFALCHGPFTEDESGLVNVDCPELVSAGYGEPGQQWMILPDYTYLGNHIAKDEQITKQTGIGDGAYRELLCKMYDGNAGQTLDPPSGYLGLWPSYRGIGIFVGGVNTSHDTWSAQATYPPISFLVARLPHNLSYSGADNQYKIVGGFNFLNPAAEITGGWSANPAEIIYEILTNQVWGLGLPTTFIDTQSFVDAGEALYTENFGLNFLFDQQTTAEDMIRQVLEHIEAALYADPDNDGKITLKLIRAVASSVTLDESNIESLDEYSRPSAFDMVNEVKISFNRGHTNVDVDGYALSWSSQEEVASAQDSALFSLQGGFVSAKRDYPGINYAALANIIAARDLKELSTPLAKIRLTANREAYALKPGDCFTLNWAPLGITGLLCRVVNIDYGRLESGSIQIDAIEDVFGLGEGIFGDPPATEWTPGSAGEGYGFDYGSNYGGS